MCDRQQQIAPDSFFKDPAGCWRASRSLFRSTHVAGNSARQRSVRPARVSYAAAQTNQHTPAALYHRTNLRISLGGRVNGRTNNKHIAHHSTPLKKFLCFRTPPESVMHSGKLQQLPLGTTLLSFPQRLKDKSALIESPGGEPTAFQILTWHGYSASASNRFVGAASQ